jgi:hypothetical protein
MGSETGQRLCFVVMAVLVILVSWSSAFSCTCISNGPPCQAYGNTAVVFVGTPIEVKTTTRENAGVESRYPQRLFTFRIEEHFRGLDAAQVEIRTGMGGGDCGYDFKVGERYLVYASFNAANGLFATSICTRTRPVSAAGEDLEYIRGLSEREPGATISGEIRRFRRNLETEQTQQLGPLSNVEISIEAEGKSFRVRTDEQGRYQLTKLAPGTYRIKPALPAELDYNNSERQAKLNDRGCSVVSFYVTDNGRIVGRVFDADGQPVPRIMINLIPVSQAESVRPQSMLASADDEGRYELKFVPPGSYLVGVRLNGLGGPESVETAYPRSYYPGVAKSSDATIITVGEGTVLKDVNLRLPPRLAKRVISGKVIWPDGRPAARASVAHHDVTYAARGLGYGITADEQGNFSFEGYEGTAYYMSAVVSGSDGKQRHSEPVDLPIRGPVNNLVLIISEPNGSCERCRNYRYGRDRSR